jgi:hypothetical protein
VSWFGLVREIDREKDGSITSLRIEQKYSQGMSDAHIQTVSINVGGDFRVRLKVKTEDLIPLVLIRVYGTVESEQDGIPVVNAVYVRVWHWFQFNFSEFGVDKSNPEWVKRREAGVTAYRARVSPEYYFERIGPTEEEARQIGDSHMAREKAAETDGK